MYRRELLQLLCCGSPSCRWQAEPPKPKDQLVDIGGYRLHARTWGGGNPCVVIDVGIGESFEPWQPVIDIISSCTCVCAYERAGYGRSDAGPYPRDTRRVARELRLLVSKIAPPPYVLVGHSLGAIHTMVVATTHPEIVAGLLLLDPPPREFVTGKRFPNLAKTASAQTEELRRMAADAREKNETGRSIFFATLASEHEALFADSGAAVRNIGTLGAIPVTVLASEIANPMFGAEAAAFQAFWIQSNRQIAALSSRGKFVLAQGCTHHIHKDAPDLVVRETMELVAIARRAAR